MGAKGYFLLFTVLMLVWTWQVISYFDFQSEAKRFVNQGPRFTANDGQALCERIQALEKEPKPCVFIPKQPLAGH